MRRSFVPVMLVCAAALSGCDDGFNPKGLFEKRLTVYGVFRTTQDSQFVRVHATYDPPAFDPLAHGDEPDLSSAVVTLQSPSGAVTIRDTLIPHPDGARYGPMLRVFYAAPLSPERGGTYTLTVQVPGYETASSTVRVPRSPAEFFATNTALLNFPRVYDSQDLTIVLKAPPEAKGFVTRLFIDYDVVSPTTQSKRIEVPFTINQIGEQTFLQFPRLTALQSSVDRPFSVVTLWAFRSEAYRFMLDSIVTKEGLANVRFRRAVVHLYMVDPGLYDYYNVANGFRDEFSIRTDTPDITNIVNGVGVFGAVTRDSLSFQLNSFIQF